ncbi:AMP-binding enzyme [Actinophytocola sp.]|uniref:AMP-binding enzyme n=1 Tax=Actinophytocola sp. TaxID=1872138 RepID=UPI002ED12FF3
MEAAALAVPGVLLAAVLPPATAGEAVLVVTGTVNADAVRAALAGSLELYKVPRRCVVVADMPLNQNGKIDKNLLGAATIAGGWTRTERDLIPFLEGLRRPLPCAAVASAPNTASASLRWSR